MVRAYSAELTYVHDAQGRPVILTTSMLAGGSGAVADSQGNTLPPGFYNAAEVFDETNPNAITVTRTVGGQSWRQTITIAGAVTTVSQWVKQ